MRQRKPLKRSSKPIPRGKPPARRKRPKQRRTTKRRRPEGTYDEAYKAAVRALPCYQCRVPAPSEPDHMGPRGLGQKSRDDECVPMCSVCHRNRTDGYIMAGRGWVRIDNGTMREWCGYAIAATRKTLGYVPGEQGRGEVDP